MFAHSRVHAYMSTHMIIYTIPNNGEDRTAAAWVGSCIKVSTKVSASFEGKLEPIQFDIVASCQIRHIRIFTCAGYTHTNCTHVRRLCIVRARTISRSDKSLKLWLSSKPRQLGRREWKRRNERAFRAFSFSHLAKERRDEETEMGKNGAARRARRESFKVVIAPISSRSSFSLSPARFSSLQRYFW